MTKYYKDNQELDDVIICVNTEHVIIDLYGRIFTLQGDKYITSDVKRFRLNEATIDLLQHSCDTRVILDNYYKYYAQHNELELARDILYVRLRGVEMRKLELDKIDRQYDLYTKMGDFSKKLEQLRSITISLRFAKTDNNFKDALDKLTEFQYELY